MAPDVPAYTGPLPFAPDELQTCNVDTLIVGLAIDHTLPVSYMHPAGRRAAEERLRRRLGQVLPGYAPARNDATRPDGASGLPPYLHFGVPGPREVMAAVADRPAGGQHKRKFADELLGWREWFHLQARGRAEPERYDRIPGWAEESRRSLNLSTRCSTARRATTPGTPASANS